MANVMITNVSHRIIKAQSFRNYTGLEGYVATKRNYTENKTGT